MSKIEKSRLQFDLSFSNFLYAKSDSVLTKINSKVQGLDEPYSTLVKNTASLFKGFGLNNLSYEYFYLFHYMLKQGYFSLVPFQFKDGSSSRYAGPMVMSGKGNSRHVASFYCDVLNEINATSDGENIAASPVLVDFFYYLDLKIMNSSMAVLVADAESYSIQDPENNLIYSTNGLLKQTPKFRCDSILKQKNLVIYPESFMAYAGLTAEMTDYHLQKMDQCESISTDELKGIKKKVKKLCKEGDSLVLFRNFYEENHDYISELSYKVTK